MKIQLEFDTGGTERFTMSSTGKIAYGTNGGGYIHNATVANTFSLSSENMILTGQYQYQVQLQLTAVQL